MKNYRTWISPGDFADLRYKIQEKGFSVVLSLLRLSGRKRTVNKWDQVTPGSDFWIIPSVRKRWNQKCTGDAETEYEDYVYEKYLKDIKDIRMLSVGCGTGARERKFGRYKNFQKIEGIDIAPSKIEEAISTARNDGLENIVYQTGDFRSFIPEPGSYDVILFNSSLHHFSRIESLISNNVVPLLKSNGILVIFEYVGPKRLQWTNEQLDRVNALLNEMPEHFRRMPGGIEIKKRVYRPGLLRMMLVDPSEAAESDQIMPVVHRHFITVEEKKVGWELLQPLLKGISHNFLSDNEETGELISYLFSEEDKYMEETGRSDAVFGIYKVK